MKNLLYCILSISFFFSACDKAEEIPSYVYIKPFELSTNDATEGANTSKITEVWAYANNDALGAYKVPGEIPIPSSGKVKLTLYPGVRNNGSSATPAIYFNYNRFDVEMDLKAGKTDTITPKITYAPDITFVWREDFETKNSLDYNVGKDSLNNFQLTKQGVKYGTTCGYFKVTDKSPTVSVTTKTTFKDIPRNERVYIEVDYKGTANLLVELAGNLVTGSKPLEVAVFKGKDDWNKAYINFRYRDYNTTEYPSFNFIFAADIPRDADGKPTATSAELRIDNIKLVYPK